REHTFKRLAVRVLELVFEKELLEHLPIDHEPGSSTFIPCLAAISSRSLMPSMSGDGCLAISSMSALNFSAVPKGRSDNCFGFSINGSPCRARSVLITSI